PSGCTQFFLGVSGSFETYNYNNAQGMQLANQQYGICIRQEAGFCGIQYSTCPDEVNTMDLAFSVSGNGTIVAPVSAVGSASCAEDWVSIPCASDVKRSITQSNDTPCEDRICGTAFASTSNAADPTTVYSKWVNCTQ
ncbi:unnamed protein product, partial [Cyprideis torosa]